MKAKPLHITFHNPNTVEETTAVLIQIAAQVASETVRQQLLRTAQEDEKKEPA